MSTDAFNTDSAIAADIAADIAAAPAVDWTKGLKLDNPINNYLVDWEKECPDTSEMIVIECADGKRFEMTKNAMLLSRTLTDMMQNSSAEDDEPIFIPSVDSDLMEKIVEYCMYHRYHPSIFLEFSTENDGKTIEDEALEFEDRPTIPVEIKRDIDMCEWDYEFSNTPDKYFLFRLTEAASYLDIKCLMYMVCRRLAMNVENMSVEEMREYFEVECDYTPEEIEEIKKECEWCNDVIA